MPRIYHDSSFLTLPTFVGWPQSVFPFYSCCFFDLCFNNFGVVHQFAVSFNPVIPSLQTRSFNKPAPFPLNCDKVNLTCFLACVLTVKGSVKFKYQGKDVISQFTATTVTRTQTELVAQNIVPDRTYLLLFVDMLTVLRITRF